MKIFLNCTVLRLDETNVSDSKAENPLVMEIDGNVLYWYDNHIANIRSMIDNKETRLVNRVYMSEVNHYTIYQTLTVNQTYRTFIINKLNELLKENYGCRIVLHDDNLVEYRVLDPDVYQPHSNIIINMFLLVPKEEKEIIV